MCRLGTVLTAALVLTGCGSDAEQQSRSTPTRTPTATATSTATPTSTATATSTATPRYPVAYRIPKALARRLVEADAYALIERAGNVVAETEWETYTALVLSAWLDERHGIRLEAPEYRTVMSRLALEQELQVIVITREHADILRRLRPSEHELRRYFARFTEDGYPEAGEAMLDWLRVFRRATSNADLDDVVVIPLLD
jgi:hypothetical protein